MLPSMRTESQSDHRLRARRDDRAQIRQSDCLHESTLAINWPGLSGPSRRSEEMVHVTSHGTDGVRSACAMARFSARCVAL